MHVHFDGDLLVYRAGFAAEKMHYEVIFNDGEESRQFQYKKEVDAWLEENPHIEDYEIEQRRVPEPVENALYNVKSIISTCLERLGVGERSLTVYLSGPLNFREGIATILPYKGNRDEKHKPVHGPAIKEYIHNRYRDVVVSDGEEADDVIAYSHYKLWREDEDSSVIASIDKDLDMVPGLHYNFIKDSLYYVDEELAEFYFMRQLLTGDSVDNIPGIRGLGKKKAEQVLQRAEDPWPSIAGEYQKQYGDNWYFALVEVGRLLWMRLEPNQWWLPPKAVRELAGE